MQQTAATATSSRMPVGFVGHGSPMTAIDPVMGAPMREWGASLPRPRAIVVISAHWEDSPVTVSNPRATEVVYDFGGFPDALYRIRHDTPAADEFATRALGLLEPFRAVSSPRGLDHGAWCPLRHMNPEADIPTIQISMPRTMRPEHLVALGEALAPLRDEGVFLLGSGNVVHNLRRIDFSGQAATPQWASEFDAWVRENLDRGDVDALCAHRERGPAATIAHPTDEHYRPLLVALGAAGSDRTRLRYTIEGFEVSSISRRSMQFG